MCLIIRNNASTHVHTPGHSVVCLECVCFDSYLFNAIYKRSWPVKLHVSMCTRILYMHNLVSTHASIYLYMHHAGTVWVVFVIELVLVDEYKTNAWLRQSAIRLHATCMRAQQYLEHHIHDSYWIGCERNACGLMCFMSALLLLPALQAMEHLADALSRRAQQ